MTVNLASMVFGAAGSESDRTAVPAPPSVFAGNEEGGAGRRGPGGPAGPVAPQTTADAAGWFALGLGGFVGGQILSVVILSVMAAANGHGKDLSVLVGEAVPPAWVVIGGLVGLWIGFGAAVVTASKWRGTGRVAADMGLVVRRFDPVVGVVVGVVGQLGLVELIYLPFEHLDPGLSKQLEQPAKHLTGGFPGVDLAVIAVLTVVVVPVIEELFFRGLVLRSLLRLFGPAGRIMGPVAAVTVTGILFGLAHAELVELAGLVAFGIVLSVLAYRYRRLGPSIFAHATFNLIAILSIAYPTGLVH